jgi:hypothetical protein
MRCSVCDRLVRAAGWPARRSRNIRTRQGLAAVLLVVAACRSPIYDAVDPVVSITTPRVWVGADIVLTSPAFSGADTLPLVLLGDDILTVRYAPPDAVRAIAPRRLGTLELRVGFPGRGPLPFGPVSLHGALVANRLAPVPYATAMAWPYGEGTFLAGVRGRLTKIDVFSGAETPMIADSLYDTSCGWGPWPAGYRALVLPAPVAGTSRGAADHCRLLAVREDGEVFDSLPGASSNFMFPSARLADGSWIRNHAKGGTDLFPRLAGGRYGLLWTAGLLEVWRLIASPDGRYVFGAVANTYTDSLAILRAGGLGAPGLLVGTGGSEAAAFSESGDTLVVHPRFGAQLLLVRSLDGHVLAAVPDTVAYSDFAFDSGHPWLYAASVDSGGVAISVTVYDLRTLEVATVLHATGSAPPQGAATVYLALDLWHRRLNAFLTDDTGNPNPGAGFSFDLMP